MNKYLKNLNKIEFVVTDACTGHCKHCSAGGHVAHGDAISADVAIDAVKNIAAIYDIKTVMTFGGEPLLYPEVVFSIHNTARDAEIPHRQVITNGFFSSDKVRVSEVARGLFLCGVNDLLLSVDAFHQESIPLDAVKIFAEELLKNNVPTRLQPAWLVSREDDNPYNERTRELLDVFSGMGLCENEGNIVFPEGNALKYLGEYFSGDLPKNPYVEDPHDVRCISFCANGDVLNGNVYKQGIVDILREYEG